MTRASVQRRRAAAALGCGAAWFLLAAAAAAWEDCPRRTPDPEREVERLCRNTIAGANDVPLFQAMARLWLGEDLAEANRLVRRAYEGLVGPGERLTPQLADERFKWQMRLWVRTYYLFNRRNGWRPGRLTPANESLMHELFWNYACAKSTCERADQRYVWFVQGSENHDLMDLSNAFLGLQAVADLPAYRPRRLPDGRAAAEHVSAWTAYYKRWAAERASRGLMIECGSPTYGKYAVPELANMADFAADPRLRRAMTLLLDLVWLDWVVEQLDGVRGGAKSRTYQGKYAREGERDSYGQMARVLLGPGSWTDGRHGHTNSGFVYCLAMTRYRLPRLVLELYDPQQRGAYVYRSRRPAKMAPLPRPPAHQPHPCWYLMDPQDTRAVRYTYCTPDYVLGSWWVDPSLGESSAARPPGQPDADSLYAAIHAQNRWQGLILRGHPDARVYPQCFTTKQDKNDPRRSVSNHQHIAVQHENVLLAQANLARRDIRAMRVYLWPGLRPELRQENGWLIARLGRSWVGVLGLDPGGREPAAGRWEDEDYWRLADWRSPVLIVADAPPALDSAAAFRRRLAAVERRVEGDTLRVRFLDGAGRPAQLEWDLRQRRLPEVNGRPIDLNPPLVYDCPYVQGRFGGRIVRARSPQSAYEWDVETGNVRRMASSSE